ncbi:ribosomal protein L17 [Hallella bergensis DSM 17361]|uniref:50S ribosomal protein L17 n=2 Tax=Hallella bergensis TaxID=242750 RepID=D1PZI9_9BACT|nr:ribosomal protein L17 [Hallella bergensis DSM 17361]
MLSNMSVSLIMHKRITTTLAKAKALKKYVEPLITRSKNDTTTNRRVVFRYLQDKYAVKELFGEVANKVADRPGGYTRVIKLGTRLGDAAEMAFIELVDFDENMAKTPKAEKKTRRSRRSRSKQNDVEQATSTDTEKAVEEVAEKTSTEAKTPKKTQAKPKKEAKEAAAAETTDGKDKAEKAE